jgi:hypothetical protein
MTSQNSNINHATSRNYELLIRNLIEQEMSGISGVEFIEILHNAKMKGLSGYEHQIDVAYRFKIWKTEMLVVVECKQYQKKVGVDDLLEFRSRIEDLRAHKGIFVTSSDFQSGAVEFAEANRIALLVVRGTQHFDICYFLYRIPRKERCRRQLELLRETYQITNTEFDSRVSIDHEKHVIVVTHDKARVIVVPGELYYSDPYRIECEFGYGDSDEIFFSGSRLSDLRADKILKSIILDELLSLQGDG